MFGTRPRRTLLRALLVTRHERERVPSCQRSRVCFCPRQSQHEVRRLTWLSNREPRGRALRVACEFSAAALFVAVGCSACSILPSHLHDSERAARTAKLAGLVNQYGEKSPGIYDTLLKTSQTIASQQDEVIARLAASRNDAISAQLPFQNGEKLAEFSHATCVSLCKTRSNLTAAINNYLTEKAAAAQDSKTAEKAIKTPQQALDAAKDDVSNWNTTIGVLEEGIVQLPPAGKSGVNGSQSGLASLERAAQAAGDKEVSYVDAAGNTQKKKISAILKDQISVSDTKVRFKIADAPGATLTILNLGVRLANLQKQAAEARLLQLGRRLQLYERVEAETELATALLAEAGDTCQAQPSRLIVPPDKPFIVQVSLLADEGRAAQQAAIEAGKSVAGQSEQQRQQRIVPKIVGANRQMLALTGDLIKVRKLAIADAIVRRASIDLEISQARLAHEESILNSQANDVAWRDVIRSGVVVLDQYEQGGFTSQNAADIVAIAQAIAVGAIAGRVH